MVVAVVVVAVVVVVIISNELLCGTYMAHSFLPFPPFLIPSLHAGVVRVDGWQLEHMVRQVTDVHHRRMFPHGRGHSHLFHVDPAEPKLARAL